MPGEGFAFDEGATRFQPAEMKSIESRKGCSVWRRIIIKRLFLIMAGSALLQVTDLSAAEKDPGAGWRTLPLITKGKIDPDWVHIGWGGFVVDDGALRTDCDPKGLGLLVYRKKAWGNCQIRVVYRTKEPKSNSGIYVRMTSGILDETKSPGAAFERNAAGRPSDETMTKMKASSEREEGPWYAVHHGYEVQIADGADPFHRTGAIYSLAASAASVPKTPGQWRTMIITLDGERVTVDVDGERATTFNPQSSDLPPRKQWYEPKREPRRPVEGYIGLQNHDPGDVVWFKEVSVRPMSK